MTDRTRLPLPGPAKPPCPRCNGWNEKWEGTYAADQMHAYSDAENASLLKQLNAAKPIIKGQDERSFHREREQKALILRANDVEGERAANAILTDENADLRAELEEWRFTNRVDELERHVTRLSEQVRVLRPLVRLLDALMVDLNCGCIPPADKAEYRASIRAAMEAK